MILTRLDSTQTTQTSLKTERIGYFFISNLNDRPRFGFRHQGKKSDIGVRWLVSMDEFDCLLDGIWRMILINEDDSIF